jgi:hypothetical protein
MGNVSLLGLGELVVKDAERRQPRAGRLDLLLADPETSTRYEVEIQLGPTDESHIIRTIEYWDIERRRYPNYDHVAVIVAEDITSRFLNVISLFNGFIPLIAIQLQALRVGEHLTLNATRVLDVSSLGTDEEDESGDQVDRSYWEQRSSTEVMAMADRILQLIRAVAPEVGFKYNRHYIGLGRDGLPDNFITFRARKQALIMEPRIARSEELTARLEEAGLDLMEFDKRWGRYRLRLTPTDLDEHEALLADLVKQARGVTDD